MANASLGLPDLGLITMNAVLEQVRCLKGRAKLSATHLRGHSAGHRNSPIVGRCYAVESVPHFIEAFLDLQAERWAV